MPSYVFCTALTLSFLYLLHAVRSAAIGEHGMWILFCIEHVRATLWHVHGEKGFCKYIYWSSLSLLLFCISFHKLIFTCILKNCILQDYKPSKQADQAALSMVQGMLCEFILKEIIDPKGSFYDCRADAAAWVLDAQKLCPSNLILVTCNLQCTCVSWCVHVYLSFLMCTCVSIYVLDVYIYVYLYMCFMCIYICASCVMCDVCWWLPNPDWFQDAARKEAKASGVADIYVTGIN